jgi:hypothetical protein
MYRSGRELKLIGQVDKISPRRWGLPREGGRAGSRGWPSHGRCGDQWVAAEPALSCRRASSTIRRASRRPHAGQGSVSEGHEGLLVVERFLGSSTPQPEAFAVTQIQTVSSHVLNQPAWAVHLVEAAVGRHQAPYGGKVTLRRRHRRRLGTARHGTSLRW